MKMRLLREKAILREAARGLVPDSVLRRRKQPFMTPLAPWFFETPESYPHQLRHMLELGLRLLSTDSRATV
jgi:asparagine synthetase B (glutamine-hydrolysing)